MAAMLMIGFIACEKTADGGNETAGNESGGTETTAPAPTPEVKPDPNANVNSAATMPKTTVEFTTETHNFGKIKQGEVVSHTFSFKNTGSEPLRIETVKPSCGCTSPEWTKEDVPPGGEGVVKMQFDSKGKNGMQNKSMTVIMNTEPQAKVLTFSGEVVAE